jgi:hypothetical protein
MNSNLQKKTVSKSKNKKYRKRFIKTHKNTKKRKNIKFGGEEDYLNNLKLVLFGIDEIKQKFDEFNTFKDATEVKQIGESSNQGFVRRIKFVRDGTSAYTILKTALEKTSDNLFYEFMVGSLLINNMKRYFPCFLETYGLYISNNENVRDFKKFVFAPINGETIDNYIMESCKYSDSLSILIQDIEKPKTFEDFFIKKNNELLNNIRSSDKAKLQNFYEVELPQLLYQIYSPLSKIAHLFTHYDLHMRNVLLYDIGKCIEIKYHKHNPKDDISFKTRYIVKIIDYGRCYFDHKLLQEDSLLYDKICGIEECDPNCGSENGYSWLAPPNIYKSGENVLCYWYPSIFSFGKAKYNSTPKEATILEHNSDNTYTVELENGLAIGNVLPEYLKNFPNYIMSSLPNISHDLRFAYMINNLINSKPGKFIINESPVIKILNAVHYENEYGTPPMQTDPKRKEKIYNVNDLEVKLSEHIKANSGKFNDEKSIGTLHVYLYNDDNGESIPMKFDQLVSQ